MEIDLAHVASRAFGSPLLLHRDKFEIILSAIGPRILEGRNTGGALNGGGLSRDLASRNGPATLARTYPGGGYLAGGGVAVIPVIGTLIRRGSWLEAPSGLMSYETIRQGIDAALADPSVNAILLELDTPGGEAGGCFDLVRHIRSAAKTAGKTVWAHANELAASAGYALACSADRIWTARTGQIGSIGVVAAHLDQSGADAKAGVTWTYIYQGARKVDANPHQPLSDRARSSIEADLRDLYGMFVDIAAEGRPKMSRSQIQSTEAAIYRGKEGVKAGLADCVGTFDEALTALRACVGESGKLAVNATRSGLFEQRIPAAVKSIAVTAAFTADQGRTTQINATVQRAEKLGLKIESSDAVARGVSAEAFRRAVLERLAERDQALSLITHSALTGSPIPNAKLDFWKRSLSRS